MYMIVYKIKCIVLFFRFLSDMLINWISVPCISAVSTVIWLYYCKKKRYLKTEVIFYEPGRNIFCEMCHHNFKVNCPDADCSTIKTKKIIHCLKNAKKSIDICIFAISNEPIAAEIVLAHKRGILIRIIISNCILIKSKEIKYFQKLGLNIKCQNDSLNSFMHHKFCVVDSKWLIHGSMNWTYQATNNNWESCLITNLECLVREFSEGFEKIWLNIN